MKKNETYRWNHNTFRVLDLSDTRYFVINCDTLQMPYWVDKSDFSCDSPVDFSLHERIYTKEEKKIIRQRFTVISNILPVVSIPKKRNAEIESSSIEFKITKQTIRKYLCLYLAYQDIHALAPAEKTEAKELSQDEKNMRWALNKFFYTTQRNTLKTAYTLLLQHKYCDLEGNLLKEYPSFYQFRYFYRKTRNLQNYYISRDGLKDYQRNHRPLLGDGVQEFANSVGMYMLDATVCDIYLCDESGLVVGRPILTAAVDAYSSLCVGYSLTWEGGVYSLRNLLLNIMTDKQDLCRKFGISIEKDTWPCEQMAGRIITDMGSEYISDTFAQLAELGVVITNLPPYRPELKGPIEKFFDLIQESYKPFLKGKGVIQSDFRQRGGKDYRKEACLTIEQFEKVVLHCILFYNSQRILPSFPFTEDMMENRVKPYANSVWNWGIQQEGVNLLEIDKEQMILTLLPRTVGKFSKYGLKVNKMRYHNPNYTQQYLLSNQIEVAYNPSDVSCVWVIQNGEFIKFDLIESRYQGKCLSEIQTMQETQKKYLQSFQEDRLKSEIELARHIQVIADSVKTEDKSIKNLRDNRKAEEKRKHVDLVREVLSE